jgi:transposase
MGQLLSRDFRRQLLAAIEDGICCCAAAALFGVAPSKAIRWQAQWRETGNVAPKPQGGDGRCSAAYAAVRYAWLYDLVIMPMLEYESQFYKNWH